MGVSYGSFTMKNQPPDYPDLESEKEWGSLQIYGLGTRVFRADKALRPYLQLRAGTQRLHPRSDLFIDEPEDPENKGLSRTHATSGFFVGVVPGLELKLTRAAYLDASFSWKYFSVEEYKFDEFPTEEGGASSDTPKIPVPPASSGSAWEARVGVTWFPNGGQSGGDSGERDAWGVKKSFGWAAGETLAINNVASITTEYIRKVNFAQISPRSWKANLDEGFTWDDNEFKTNQWVHPFNGAAYYNSGRGNGLGFWESSAFAVAGAFYWECCGETHPISFNDQISTGIGGIALGEAQYRLSSEILNNQSGGMGRFWREFGAFLVDPVRGFNRLLSGDASAKSSNPTDAMDWRPEGSRTMVATGFRSIGEGSSITEQHEVVRDHPAQPHLRRRVGEHAPEALRLHRLRRRDQLRREGRPRQRADPRRSRLVGRRQRGQPRPAARPVLRLHQQQRLRVRRPERGRGLLVAVPPLGPLRPDDARRRQRRSSSGRSTRTIRSSPTSRSRSASASTTTARASAPRRRWPCR